MIKMNKKQLLAYKLTILDELEKKIFEGERAEREKRDIDKQIEELLIDVLNEYGVKGGSQCWFS